MIFSVTSILPLLALLAAPVLSAPIVISGHSVDGVAVHPFHSGLETRSPLYLGHHYVSGTTTVARRDVQSGFLVARDELTAGLAARSFDDITELPLAKRADAAEPVRLVKRKSIAAKIRAAFKKVGSKIKSGFQKVGQKIKTGFQKAGKAIKTGFQKAGKAIKKAAVKVGKFIKTTGAKIAKFGLKIYATATKIASKVVGFIPGVGKAVGKVLSGASAAANFVSDKIHVSLGKKLDKGMKVMDRIQHPIKGAAGKVLDAIFKRDFVGGEELVERDLSELDSRSLDDEELFERDLLDLEIRSFDDGLELEARSVFQKDCT